MSKLAVRYITAQGLVLPGVGTEDEATDAFAILNFRGNILNIHTDLCLFYITKVPML